ncbi:MAG TPA: hypothetical protein VKB80_31455 [Kofleriaceae bacterium]|nr:hypothetical protein [Kofleriaceae bacterium]
MRRTAALPVTAVALALAAAAALAAGGAQAQTFRHNFAGSVQIDYLEVPTERIAANQAFDGATVELSLKLAIDFGDRVSANVKVCVACHGLETGMAFFDLRVADELNVRVGRFTPAFGNFPIRHDPANHRTSDKPLPYDMGRMLRLREWNMSILPSPWVDNGIELDGTFFGERGQLDYAVYAVGGPKAAADSVDFDFIQSRSPERYYLDNNSEPSVGARLSGTLDSGRLSLSLGASAMAGRYDPERRLDFAIAGADLVLQLDKLYVRAEYLLRWTEMSLGDDPDSRFRYGPGEDGEFDDHFVKDGFYGEVERAFGDFELIGRFDGLRRHGNVLATSELRSRSLLLRYTAGLAYRLPGGLRLKTSAELYDFSDFDDELALHLGIAGSF